MSWNDEQRWTNIAFQIASLKSLKRKQNALKLETTRVCSQFFVEGNKYICSEKFRHGFEN